MAEVNEEEVIKVDYYNSVMIEEYNGKYSICAVDNGQNECFYKKWVFLSRWRNGEAVPDDRKMPMKVALGDDKAQAVRTLETLLVKLKGTR